MDKHLEDKLYEEFPDILYWPGMFLEEGDDVDNPPRRHKQAIGVGNGWYELIHTICWYIKQRVEENNSRYKFYQDMKKTDPEKAKAYSKNAWCPTRKIQPPYAEQIKEKFGGLRFYTSGIPVEISDEIHGVIEACESLSGVICEDCGNKGKSISVGGWIRTLCRNCLETQLYNNRYINKLGRYKILKEYDKDENI